MLRATSEIAVAISVSSVAENGSWAASVRPWARAVTTSASELIGTRTSAGTVAGLLGPPAEQGEPLLQVQRGVHALEVEAELDHRERHLGLDPDDHRLRPAQPGQVGDAAQRARGEGIHHVERRDVDDDAARAVAPDAFHQVVAQLEHVGVRHRRLDRGGEVWAL